MVSAIGRESLRGRWFEVLDLEVRTPGIEELLAIDGDNQPGDEHECINRNDQWECPGILVGQVSFTQTA